MAFSASRTGSMAATINVTPLIDVLLVLLIIFMVVTPLKTRGLPTAVPQAPAAVPPSGGQPDPTVVIAVAADGSLRLNTQMATAEDIAKRLAERMKSGAGRAVFVTGDPGLEFRAIVRAVDIAKGAGASTIALMTPRMQEGGR
jgi:biopolymer transport protein TolR